MPEFKLTLFVYWNVSSDEGFLDHNNPLMSDWTWWHAGKKKKYGITIKYLCSV